MSLAAEPLLSLAVTVTSEQRVKSVLRNIVQGLASQPGVALTRIWLLPSADLCGSGQEPSRSPEQTEYLRLVASAGTPVNSPGEDWSFLQGHFSRLPLNVGKVGQVAANRNPILIRDLLRQNDCLLRPEWAKREGIRSFAGHPLLFRDNLLGVIGFSAVKLLRSKNLLGWDYLRIRLRSLSQTPGHSKRWIGFGVNSKAKKTTSRNKSQSGRRRRRRCGRRRRISRAPAE